MQDCAVLSEICPWVFPASMMYLGDELQRCHCNFVKFALRDVLWDRSGRRGLVRQLAWWFGLVPTSVRKGKCPVKTPDLRWAPENADLTCPFSEAALLPLPVLSSALGRFSQVTSVSRTALKAECNAGEVFMPKSWEHHGINGLLKTEEDFSGLKQ